MKFTVAYCLVVFVMYLSCQAVFIPQPAAAVPVVPTPLVANLPVPVQDTPEVAAAKRDHAVKWIAAKNAADVANLRNYGAPYSGFSGSFYPYDSSYGYNYGNPSVHNYDGFPSTYNFRNPYSYNYPSNFYSSPYGVIPPNVAASRVVVPI